MPFAIQFATPRRTRPLRASTGHSAHPSAIYVTTARQATRFGISTQHSGKYERDCPYRPNNDFTHMNLPLAKRERDEINTQCLARSSANPSLQFTTTVMVPLFSSCMEGALAAPLDELPAARGTIGFSAR